MAFAHSRGTSCVVPSVAENHQWGADLKSVPTPSVQCRYKPSPNIPIIYVTQARKLNHQNYPGGTDIYPLTFKE